MTINIREMLARSMAREQAEHAEKEKLKLGVLRAGNSGVMIEAGRKGLPTPAGSCPRTAHLRSLGIDLETPTDDKLIMFAGGFLNEDYWYAKLKADWEPGLILREHEIPIEWMSGDTQVTGRPDMVLCDEINLPDENGPRFINVPVLGIELKGMASIWTARDVSFSQGVPQGPKMNHLCQAGHYSWKLGEKYNLPAPLPYKIIYSSYVNFPSPLMFASDGTKEKMEHKMFPRPGDPGSEKCEYGDSGWLKNVIPHHMIYDIAWDMSEDGTDGQLKFCEEGTDKYISSPVTWGGIERYYEQVRRTSMDLGQRPVTQSSSGTKLNYSMCGYCPLEAVCDKHEGAGYERWLHEVKNHLTETKGRKK